MIIAIAKHMFIQAMSSSKDSKTEFLLKTEQKNNYGNWLFCAVSHYFLSETSQSDWEKVNQRLEENK